ncbi:glycoside hydrolase family 125 protein [Ferdinandcohnia quinoae]|uniref:Glycoside hydrolase family 125 protein n=1 Tax=Fredinandcohnia quinoae TaxID=2918902 RepID=A0AAW5E0V8_9BACI|nr:glycoside hydrolase family 125 protein [Fredinandcohnia sp. SECRCQ15]MCH1625214.1 glycoside hydrolase family 125 protein [Fredinandcohnia sp. SECRCQ15]
MSSEKTIPQSLTRLIDEVKEHFPEDQKLQEMFEQCFVNTYETTLMPQEDGTTFVITGDIPAMWLRDSAAQVRPYLLAAEEDEEMAKLIEGVVRRQMNYILQDPYANAFNETSNGKGHQADITDMSPIIWERKYEIDSLCYPIQLSYLLWKSTGKTTHFDETFSQALTKILHVWRVEQNHEEESPYSFERLDVRQSDTLNRNGKGSKTVKTGMTWSGFRPSDDACLYGYLVPANMFAVVVLGYATEISRDILKDENLATQCDQLAFEIKAGIEEFAVLEHPIYGDMYVYETDGMGRYNLMDDANVPSLLASPYLGWCQFDDKTYLNTRSFLLSRDNPYYYEGKAANGIGSPHTPDHYIWHIALAIEGMTTTDTAEKMRILEVMKQTDGGTGFMHEGFNTDQPEEFTREWFSWANSMFSEFVLSLCGLAVKGSPLHKRLQETNI